MFHKNIKELLREVDLLFNSNATPGTSELYDAAEKIGEAKHHLKAWLNVEQRRGSNYYASNFGDIILLYQIDDKLNCIENYIYNLTQPISLHDKKTYSIRIRKYLSELFSLLAKASPKPQTIISQFILELPTNSN